MFSFFGLMPFGLQFGSVPPELASRFRCPLAVFLFAAVLQRLKLSARLGTIAGIPNKRFVRSLIWEGASCSALARQDAMVVDVEQERSSRLVLADWVRAHQRRSSRRSNGACSSSRRPAAAALLPLLLAEWRLLLFLPAMEPLRRQISVWLEATARSGGNLVVPSGMFPGDGEVQSDRKLRTRSLFCTSVEGPSCKVQGPVCNFHVPLGPVCNMSSFLVE